MLRAVAWAALAVTGWLAWRAEDRPPVRGVDGVPAVTQLARWAVAPPADTLRVAFEGLPSDSARARIAALTGAGMVVTWRDAGVPPLATGAELDEATGLGLVLTAGGAVDLADAAGPVGRAQGAMLVPGLVLPLAGAARPSVERVAARRAVVVGRPSWELRWAMRALEAAGWEVAAEIDLAPGVTGGGATLDTARTGLVVVLDTIGAARGRAVAAYVRSGGGAILTPAALGTPALAAIAPGGAGPLIRPPASLALPAVRADLAYRPVIRLVDNAVPLDGDRVVARVEGEGRVVLAGDQETWRLALASDAGRAVHREHWTRLADAARHRPSAGRIPGDPAPRTALMAAFGPPADRPTPWVPDWPWEALTFGVAVAALLAEWTLRRMSGRA